ncbi:MAG: nuclear transport factor 2 family protein [Cellvibrionales bacterium]|nr:nuclear transport factor 2 family protein [Cellvibrionales bacterium]
MNDSTQLEMMKNAAINFYQMAYMGQPEEAVALYVGDEYLQHNPDVADGKQGFIDYFDRMASEYPEKNITFERVVAEGNLVALHTHQTWLDQEEYVTMDFFRFNTSGKIIEHWDSIQRIPDQSKNGRLMY